MAKGLDLTTATGYILVDTTLMCGITNTYSTMSAQQMSLVPENASQNDAIFPKSRYGIYQTTSQWLSSYGCAIIVLYCDYIYIIPTQHAL